MSINKSVYTGNACSKQVIVMDQCGNPRHSYYTCGQDHDRRNPNWKPFRLMNQYCRKQGLDDYEAREMIEPRIGRRLMRVMGTFLIFPFCQKIRESKERPQQLSQLSVWFQLVTRSLCWLSIKRPTISQRMVSIHFATVRFNAEPHQAVTEVEIPCPLSNPIWQPKIIAPF